MKKWSSVVCVVVLVLAMAGVANALTLNAVDGEWKNVSGGNPFSYEWREESVSYGSGTEKQIRWGDPVGNDKSGLGFTGSAPPDVAFGVGDTFEIGQLRHFNNPVSGGTAAESAVLEISLTFSDPVLGPETFDFTFEIDETPNAPGPPASDDIIDFPASYATETFLIGDTEYTLQLLGFGDSAEDLLDQFVSPEGTTNETLLWGRITTASTIIPEPATIFLLGLGLFALLGLGRKFNK